MAIRSWISPLDCLRGFACGGGGGGGAMSHELLNEWRSTSAQNERERYVAVAPCRTNCWTSGARRLYKTKENVMCRWRHVARTAERVALYVCTKRKRTLCGGGAMSHELLDEWRSTSVQTNENNHQTKVILAVVIRIHLMYNRCFDN